MGVYLLDLDTCVFYLRLLVIITLYYKLVRVLLSLPLSWTWRDLHQGPFYLSCTTWDTQSVLTCRTHESYRSLPDFSSVIVHLTTFSDLNLQDGLTISQIVKKKKIIVDRSSVSPGY